MEGWILVICYTLFSYDIFLSQIKNRNSSTQQHQRNERSCQSLTSRSTCSFYFTILLFIDEINDTRLQSLTEPSVKVFPTRLYSYSLSQESPMEASVEAYARSLLLLFLTEECFLGTNSQLRRESTCYRKSRTDLDLWDQEWKNQKKQRTMEDQLADLHQGFKSEDFPWGEC